MPRAMTAPQVVVLNQLTRVYPGALTTPELQNRLRCRHDDWDDPPPGKLRFSQVYPALRQLEARGLAVAFKHGDSRAIMWAAMYPARQGVS